jgi:putative transposase
MFASSFTMANTYSQIYIQIIFAVKGRANLIAISWESDLYKYITKIIQNKNQLVIAIGGMPDHIHILIALKPSCNLSDLVREIKKSTNEFINERKYVKGRFYWQEGFGAFSHSSWDADKIKSYVLGQKAHHKKTSFEEEYYQLLETFKIEFQENYLFDFYSHPPKS